MRHNVFKNEFLLFERVDQCGVGEWPVFFEIQFFFQFSMLVLQCGYMVGVHLILLVVRLDDLVAADNHEKLPLSASISTDMDIMRRST